MIVLFFALCFVLLLVWVVRGVRIVHPYQRGIVERLGKYKETVDPGMRIILPVIETLRLVDMREQVVDVPPQEVITKDNVVVSVDAVVYFEPTDPQRLVYNVANFMMAIVKLAQTNLRNLVGDLQLDEALTGRDTINAHLREILDDATDKWGVKVVRVEIQRIDPPPDVMHAMHEQMKSERNRRAVVTSASGEREAAISRAEGDRAAAILHAEAAKQQQILRAEGQAQAMRAIADAERYRTAATGMGQAEAIRQVYRAIHDGNPTPDVLAVKYLETLKDIADGQATKIFLPAESSAFLGSIAGVAEMFRNGTANAGPAPAPSSGPIPASHQPMPVPTTAPASTAPPAPPDGPARQGPAELPPGL